MDTHIKKLIQQDFARSGKDLGQFALDYMKIYDDFSYELELIDVQGKNGRVMGRAVMDSYQKILDLISLYELRGEYKIRIIDAQHEFFCIMAQIRDDLKISK